MKPFRYRGSLSASKSLMNRALIAQSMNDKLQIIGESQCDDVHHLKVALMNFKQSLSFEYDCGEGGTTLRFLLARLSREQGEFRLFGSERLFERPHQPLFATLEKLGAKIAREEKGCVVLKAQGWDTSTVLSMDLEYSSQFISALLLSAWELDQPLKIQLGESQKSWSYLAMTVRFLTSLGMEILLSEDSLTVMPGQKVQVDSVTIEPDMSSCFSLACFAAYNGELVVDNFPVDSSQPDFAFLSMLHEVGVPMHFQGESGQLIVHKAEDPKPVDLDLKNNPDLFPVMAVFLSRVPGLSSLTGLDSLVHKESNRLQNTLNLLSELGFQCSVQNKRFQIQGKRVHAYPNHFEFDPDQDHRMAMAAALAKHQGAGIEIANPQVVNKSFPEFWEILGW